MAEMITNDEWLDLGDGEEGIMRQTIDGVSGGCILLRGPDWTMTSIEVRDADVVNGLESWIGRTLNVVVMRGEDGPYTTGAKLLQAMMDEDLRTAA